MTLRQRWSEFWNPYVDSSWAVWWGAILAAVVAIVLIVVFG